MFKLPKSEKGGHSFKIPGMGGADGTLHGEMGVHAEHFWQYLDDLHQKDPKAYQDFISSQKAKAKETWGKEAAEEDQFLPKPCFAFSTGVLSSTKKQSINSGEVLFVNMCHSEEVGEAQQKDKPEGTLAPEGTAVSKLVIPLSVGPLRTVTVDKDNMLVVEDTPSARKVKTCDVVFALKLMKRAETDMELKLAIIELALSYSEEDHSVTLSRQYKFLEGDKVYIGGKPKAQMTEKGLKDLQEKLRQQATTAAQGSTKAEIIMPGLSTTSAIKKEAGIGGEDKELDLTTLKLSSSSSSSSTGPTSSNKVLIEEVKEKTKKPVYSLKITSGVLRLEVSTPLASKASDMTIDISSSRIVLGGDLYMLDLMLPKSINDNDAAAKYSKKTRTLTITGTLM